MIRVESQTYSFEIFENNRKIFTGAKDTFFLYLTFFQGNAIINISSKTRTYKINVKNTNYLGARDSMLDITSKIFEDSNLT